MGRDPIGACGNVDPSQSCPPIRPTHQHPRRPPGDEPQDYPPDARTVIVGVDTHTHVHVAVAIDTWGIRLGDRSGAADSDGYQQLITFPDASRIGIKSHRNLRWPTWLRCARISRASDAHDRDGKYCPAFADTITDGGVTPVRLPPRSPNLNPHAERWVRSVKDECHLEADSDRRARVTDRVECITSSTSTARRITSAAENLLPAPRDQALLKRCRGALRRAIDTPTASA